MTDPRALMDLLFEVMGCVQCEEAVCPAHVQAIEAATTTMLDEDSGVWGGEGRYLTYREVAALGLKTP